ncbi:MAG: hypothetical protein AAFQ82_25085, partial [Myxococcota bacterium]
MGDDHHRALCALGFLKPRALLFSQYVLRIFENSGRCDDMILWDRDPNIEVSKREGSSPSSLETSMF